MKTLVAFVFILALPCSGFGQVGEIKQASASNSSTGRISGGDGSFSGGSFAGDLVFNVFFGGVINAQRARLERRNEIPGLVSFEMMFHGAAQPSAYYIIHPRLRANWGLFSTDFRFNYILEEGMDGIEMLRTNDWQVLQVNLVTTRDITVRLGGGFLQEAFNERAAFAEWTGAFRYQPLFHKLGGFTEYRGSEARKEFSIWAQYKLFDNKTFHGYASAGFVYQRYYQTVSTSGIQAGLIVSIY